MQFDESLLKKTLESIPETILIVDEEMQIIKVIPNNKDIAITEEAENYPVDSIPGVKYPGNMALEIVEAIESCRKKDVPATRDFLLQVEDERYVYLKARLVPFEHKYVILYLNDQTDIVHRERGMHHKDRTYMLELALKHNKMSAYSFSFTRFNSCDRVNCNRCFQFYGDTNDLLNRNKHICRSLPVLSHPDDRKDFFFLFNNLRGQRMNEANVSFRLKNKEGEYQQYRVYGKVDAFDGEGKADLIIGNIVETQALPKP
jgi:hypothetical protein